MTGEIPPDHPDPASVERVDEAPELNRAHDIDGRPEVRGLDPSRPHVARRHPLSRAFRRGVDGAVVDVDPCAEPGEDGGVSTFGGRRLGSTDAADRRREHTACHHAKHTATVRTPHEEDVKAGLGSSVDENRDRGTRGTTDAEPGFPSAIDRREPDLPWNATSRIW